MSQLPGQPLFGGKAYKSSTISCEQKWLDELEFRKAVRFATPPETEEEFMARCKGTLVPSTETKAVAVGSNWLLPALLIGAGVFILTKKSE